MENNGTTEIVLEKKSYCWEIINFTLLSKPTGSALRSPSFSCGPNEDFTWHLLLYPNGENSENANSVSLKIALEKSRSFPLSAEITFSTLVDNSTKMNYTLKHVFQKSNETFGVAQFLRHYSSYLTDCLCWKQNVQDNKLIIKCDLTVVMDIITSTPIVKSISPEEYNLNLLSRDFQALWLSETFSDFTLIVDGEKINVHKTILAARSPVFAALIKHDMKEKKHNSMEIEDVDCDIVKEMLRFIYTGKVENLDIVAFELLKLADKYQLDELKEICGKTLGKRIAEDNAIDILILAELNQIKKLKKRALDFIVQNVKSFIDNKKFKPLHDSPNYHSLYDEIMMHAIALKCNI